jgi:hypothetical protein
LPLPLKWAINTSLQFSSTLFFFLINRQTKYWRDPTKKYQCWKKLFFNSIKNSQRNQIEHKLSNILPKEFFNPIICSNINSFRLSQANHCNRIRQNINSKKNKSFHGIQIIAWLLNLNRQFPCEFCGQKKADN